MMKYVTEEREKNGFETAEVVTMLTLPLFLKVWRQQCPKLQITWPGSDFCDRRSYLYNLLSTEIDDDKKGSI